MDPSDPLQSALGMLIAPLAGIALGSLIGMIPLRAAARWVAKIDVSFGNAFMTVFLAGVVTILMAVGLAVAAESALAPPRGSSGRLAAGLLGPVLAFLIQTGFVRGRLKLPFGQATLVTLVTVGILLALVMMVAAVAWFSGLG